MSDKAAFSIIIPVYNVQKDIGNCLDSILAQSYRNFEVLCIDDGSTDHSSQVIQKYAKKDKRIQYFYHENKGVSYTRNVGIRKARGKYIWFVDADDWVEADALQCLVQEIKKQKSDIVVFGGEVFFSEDYDEQDSYMDHAFIYFKKNLTTRRIRYINNSVAALLYEIGSYPLIWNKVYKRSLIVSNHIRYEESLKLGEDEAFLFQIYPLAERISYIPNRLYHYQRNRQGSATEQIVKKEKKRAEQNLKMAKIVAEYWEREELFPEYTFPYLERYTSLLYDSAMAVKADRSYYKQFVRQANDFFAEKFEMYQEFSLRALAQSKVWGWREFRLGAKILYVPNKLRVFKDYRKCFGLGTAVKKMIPHWKCIVTEQMQKWQFGTFLYYFYFYIWKGYKEYLALKNKWGKNCVFLSCAVLGTGDLYQVSLMLPQWLKENHIKQYCMLVVGNSEKALAEKMFSSLYQGHLQKIEMRTHERLRRLLTFVGKNEIDFHYFCHFDNLSDYLQITWKIQGKYGWNMLELYKHKGMNLNDPVSLKLPEIKMQENDSQHIFASMELQQGKTALLAPYATCADGIPENFWTHIVEILRKKGYSVCTNCGADEQPVARTKSVFVPYNQIIDFCNRAGLFIGIRSGLSDIISSSSCKKILIYPEYSNAWPDDVSIAYLGLQEMGLAQDVKEYAAGEMSWQEICDDCEKYI